MKRLAKFFLVSLAAAGLAANAFADDIPLVQWAFDADMQGWSYGNGWEWQYQNGEVSSASYDAEKQALKVTVDFTADADKDFSQLAISTWNEEMDLNGAVKVKFDFYYDPSCMTKGSFQVKVFSNDAKIEQLAAMLPRNAVDAEGGLKCIHMEVPITIVRCEQSRDFALCLVGSKTDYKGDFWVDNVELVKIGKAAKPEKAKKEKKSKK